VFLFCNGKGEVLVLDGHSLERECLVFLEECSTAETVCGGFLHCVLG
jgi:hypothetical protein